jgi:hypothetical protein
MAISIIATCISVPRYQNFLRKNEGKARLVMLVILGILNLALNSSVGVVKTTTSFRNQEKIQLLLHHIYFLYEKHLHHFSPGFVEHLYDFCMVRAPQIQRDEMVRIAATRGGCPDKLGDCTF